MQFGNAIVAATSDRHTPKYLKALNDTQLKEIMRLREQVREAEDQVHRVKKTSQKKIEEVRSQLQDKDKIIESLEYQVDITRKELVHTQKDLADVRADKDSQSG